jgi:hypothetical protein
MQTPPDPQTPAAPPAAPPEPGEPRRVLDRPPSERYAAEAPAATADAPAQRAARAVGVGLVGAAVVAFLGGPLSVTLGLIVVAAVIGWAVGSVARPSLGLAIGVAVGSVAVGLIGIWLFARFEGGVLGLPDYFAEVQGPVVLLELAVAGLVAAGTVR